jgi:hypothetical protein
VPPPIAQPGRDIVSKALEDVTKLLKTYVHRELGPQATPHAAHALLIEAQVFELEFDAERFTTLEVDAVLEPISPS